MVEGLKPYVKVFGYGGLDPRVMHCLQKRLTGSPYAWQVELQPGDGAVDRQRATATDEFLHSGCNVMVQIDHDVTWGVGDLEYLAEQAYLREAVVGGCYGKRAYKQGWGCAFQDGVRHEIGSDEIFELGENQYLAAGFMAVHIQVFHDMMHLDDCEINTAGWHPFYLPLQYKYDLDCPPVYLSEDYAFCYRARVAGRRVFCTMRPILGHWGTACFAPNEGNQVGPVFYKQAVVR